MTAVDDRLAGWLRADFGLVLVAAEPVPYGADDTAQLWRATTADGAQWAVKLSGGGTPAGLLVTAHLAGQGVPGIAAPLATRDGRRCGVHEERRLSVVPWLTADRALAGGMGPAHWRAYGEVLAATHAVAPTDELAALLPREDHTHAAVGAATRATDRRLRAVGDGADRWTREVAARWRAAADDVSTLLDRVDRLGAPVAGPAGGAGGLPR